MTVHATILVNAKTNTYHPMIFYPNPLPSEDLEVGKVCRHKSKGHHTVGFPTLAEAEQEIKDRGWWPTGILDPWDGEGIPATIMFFPADTPCTEAVS